jgi:CRISPR/Cas system-associated exonuclease Cas4 (RecB family)
MEAGMEFFGFAITALAAILTYQAWKNGRWMKQAHQDSQDFLKEMRKESAEFFKKMDERSERMDERAAEQSRILREVQASAERIEETQKYVAELVRIEGEKTRTLISHTH